MLQGSIPRGGRLGEEPLGTLVSRWFRAARMHQKNDSCADIWIPEGFGLYPPAALAEPGEQVTYLIPKSSVQETKVMVSGLGLRA